MPYNYYEGLQIGSRTILEEIPQQSMIIWQNKVGTIFNTNYINWEKWLVDNDFRKEGDISPITGLKYVKAICGQCKTELHYSKLIPEYQKQLVLCIRCCKIKTEANRKVRK